VRYAGWLVVVVLVVLVGFVLFAARGPQAGNAFTLRVGDCFDVPATDTVGDISAQPCTSPHDGEVFLAQDYPGVAGPLPYPGVDAIRTFVDQECVKGAFEPYVGEPYASRPDIMVGYFFPPADAWSRGVRRVTCYVAPSNGSKASAPFASSAPSASSAPAASSAPSASSEPPAEPAAS
jgi:hypothetical protein